MSCNIENVSLSLEAAIEVIEKEAPVDCGCVESLLYSLRAIHRSFNHGMFGQLEEYRKLSHAVNQFNDLTNNGKENVTVEN